MFEIILYSLLIMLASLAGVFSVWKKAGDLIEENLHYLVSFSAGVFLIISYQLIVESLHLSHDVGPAVFWVLIGMIGIWFIFKLIPEFHNHEHEHEHLHDDGHLDKHNHNDHKQQKINPKKMILSDSLHNIGDGILIASAFSISSVFGIATAVGILVHELVQEVSEFFVLRSAGFSTKTALIINFSVSSTILIGSVGGFFLLERFEILEIPLLAIAGGAFLIVVLQDLIPHSVRDSLSKKHYFKHILLFAIGLSLMSFVNAQFSHEHEDDEHGHGDHEHAEIHNEDEEYADEHNNEEHHEDDRHADEDHD